MKKVLVIAPYPYLPFFSGGQKFIAQFLEWLGKETELTVITSEGNDLSLAKNYKTIPLLKSSFSRYYDRSLISKISSLAKSEKFDCIIWEHPYFSWLAFRVRKRTGIPMIIHTHNIEYQRFRSTGRWWWPILKWYEKKAFRKADKLFFITPEDKLFAVNEWKINEDKCIDLPFGIVIENYPGDRESSKKLIQQKHAIRENEKIIFFNGLLSYKPNLDALKVIIDKINPQLAAQSSIPYKIIVCGKGLPDHMNSLKDQIVNNIIYAGFVDDIETYFKATDIFLNPVQSGGGIKTKMVEAIAFGATVIATQTAATGVNPGIAGSKLIIVDDYDWKNFVKAVIEKMGDSSSTPDRFYEHFYWGNIIKRVVAALG